MKKLICITAIIYMLVFQNFCQQQAQKISLKDESFKTMMLLVESLSELQITETTDADFGALQCNGCNILHTRAAEAVYPFAVAYKYARDEKYLESAIDLGNWLIKQQFPDGAWKETPEEWTGTTTDQLLMMVLTFQIIKGDLSASELENWENSIRLAADYLTEVMTPDFASINYCATTTASLAITNKYFADDRYLKKAKELSRQVLSKMNEEGFIAAEGDRVYGVKYGADVGYEIDMSLWGLTLYARISGDSSVENQVRQSLKNHLYFVYPNGAIDGSWGIRSNKWTTFGSATADGCQILFSLFAGEDSRYRTAAMRNLEYLRKMIKDGLIGYGPHYWDIFEDPPCIYPTFARCKNLAMTVELGEQEPGPVPPLPTEEIGWIRHFPTVDVAQVRTKNFMTTITAYRYKDLRKRNKSKYMHRPTGGAISKLWVKDHGFLQLSSQTEYHRWEPMHFPEAKGILPLTPRIEFENENGYFTNLYEFDGRLTVENNKAGAMAVITTSGELCDHKLYPGGVAYSLQHIVSDDAIEKIVKLRYHDGKRDVSIIEPIVKQSGIVFEHIDSRTMLIKGENRTLKFKVVAGDVILEAGKDEDKYWAVFPSIKCYPIILHVNFPKNDFKQQVIYRISIVK